MTLLLFATLALLVGFAAFALVTGAREAPASARREAGMPFSLLGWLDDLPPSWVLGLSAVMLVWIVGWLVVLAGGLIFLAS